MTLCFSLSSSVQPSLLPVCGYWWDGAEAAVAPVEFAHRGGQIRLAEIGPHARRENQFRVGAFPQQEIAETPFSAGANQHVDRRAEGPPQRLARKADGASGGRQNGIAAGIIEGNAQPQPAPPGSGCLSLCDGLPQRGVQTIAPPD